MIDDGEIVKYEGPAARRSLTEIEADRQRQAFDVAFPIPSQLNERVPLISRIHEAEAPVLVRAKIQLALIQAVRDDKRLDAVALAPVETMLSLLVSSGGKGRKEIVDIARVQPREQRRPGLLSWFGR